MEARRREEQEREAMARERELNDQDHNEEVNMAFSSLANMGTALHEPQDLVETFTAMREPDYTWGSLHLYRNHILFTSSMLSTQVSTANNGRTPLAAARRLYYNQEAAALALVQAGATG